jgi:trigger factor
MQVTKEQIDPCTVGLDIEVDAETVSQGFTRAIKEFGKFTNVPGFRPGKAPRAMVEKYVNQERLRERVMELVAGPAYRDALKQEDITPYMDPEVDFSDLADGQPWQFKAVVPLAPEVTLGDTEGIAVERPVYEVTEQDIDNQVEALRGEHARLEKAEDRGVQEGDVVIAEMGVTMEGEERAEPKRTLVRIGDNIPGFDEAIMGQQIDEEREFDLTYPEDHQDAEKAGKPAHFQVRVVSVNSRVLPEVTDEWISSITPFESVESLRQAIREHHENQIRDLSDRVAEGRIIEELLSRSEVKYPQVLVRQEMEEEAEQLSGELQRNKLTYEQYLQQNGLTDEQVQERMAQTAVERVVSYLLLGELAKREGIQVTGEEVAQEFARLAGENQWSEEDTRRIIRDQRRRNQVANMVMRRKLRDRLFEIATVTDVAARTDSADGADGAEPAEAVE